MSRSMAEQGVIAGRHDPAQGAARRATKLCLIVHDELDLRLRLAALVRRALPALGADSIDRATFAAMTVDRLGAYVSVLFIVTLPRPLEKVQLLRLLGVVVATPDRLVDHDATSSTVRADQPVTHVERRACSALSIATAGAKREPA